LRSSAEQSFAAKVKLNIAKKQGKVKSLPNSRIKFLTKGQVEKFFSVVKLSRDRAIFATILEFSLRGQECSLLDLEDIDWKAKIIYIYQLKGSNSETYRLSPKLFDKFNDYVNNHRLSTEGRGLFTARQGGISLKILQFWFYIYLEGSLRGEKRFQFALSEAYCNCVGFEDRARPLRSY